MALPGKFLYCFIREAEPVTFMTTALAGAISPVYAIPVDGISAVVSDAALTEYDPTRKNLMAFQKVISSIMKKYDILPVAFGTVAQNKRDVEGMIRANYEEFQQQLDYFHQKMEMGLRITWNDAFFHEDIEDEEIKNLKDYLNGKEENEAMSETILLGKMVQASIEQKREEYGQLIYEPLAQLAVEAKNKEQLSIKTVLSASFLIEEEQCDAFDKKVEELYKPLEGKLNFSYTGPWPPYNFIDLKLKPESESEG